MRPKAALLGVTAVALGLTASAMAPLADLQPQSREFTVIGNNFAFSPSTLEVRQNDVVRIVFRAEDIPHTFTIDEYRIAKRAGRGQTVIVEFRADRAGRFVIYCSLRTDDRCRTMKGELVVRP